jgi:serine/threonine protein kinase
MDKDIKERLKIIQTNLLTLSLLMSDLNRLSSASSSQEINVLTKYRFFWRIWKSLYCLTIIEINILVNSKEYHSIPKVITLLINSYKKIPWHHTISITELEKIKDSFNTPDIKQIIEKLKYIRDKGITHHDLNLENIGIELKEIISIVDLLFTSYNRIQFGLFNKTLLFEFSELDKGHYLISDLEKYDKITTLVSEANHSIVNEIDTNKLLHIIRS